MQELVVRVIIGSLIGLAASFVMRTYAKPGLRANILVGIAGAVFAGFVLTPLLRYGSFNPVAFIYAAMLM